MGRHAHNKAPSLRRSRRRERWAPHRDPRAQPLRAGIQRVSPTPLEFASSTVVRDTNSATTLAWGEA